MRTISISNIILDIVPNINHLTRTISNIIIDIVPNINHILYVKPDRRG